MKSLTPIYLAIACITILELFALYKGVNGSVMMTSLAAISGLGGYVIGKSRKPKE